MQKCIEPLESGAGVKQSTEYAKLLIEIARCEELPLSANVEHSCHCVVTSQGDNQAAYHAPEPWSGDLQNASILFIGSNPAIDEEEYFPTGLADDSHILEFFHNRFEPANTMNYLRPRNIDGSFREAKRWVRYWASVRQIACAITKCKKHQLVPGKHYCLTEVVHCKSNGETGVDEAVEMCSNKYLNRILTLSGAKVVFVLGARAKSCLVSLLNLENEPRVVEKHHRLYVFMHHPNHRGVRKFDSYFSKPERKRIQDYWKTSRQ